MGVSRLAEKEARYSTVFLAGSGNLVTVPERMLSVNREYADLARSGLVATNCSILLLRRMPVRPITKSLAWSGPSRALKAWSIRSSRAASSPMEVVSGVRLGSRISKAIGSSMACPPPFFFPARIDDQVLTDSTMYSVSQAVSLLFYHVDKNTNPQGQGPPGASSRHGRLSHATPSWS